MKKIAFSFLLPLCGLISAAPASATETIFSSTTDVEDATLRGDNSQVSAASNYGGASTLLLGSPSAGVETNVLMRFNNLDTQLAGQTVTDVTLRLYLTNHASQTANLSIELYELTAANAGWVEGSGTGTVESGTACWRFLSQNTVEWAGGRNGAGVAGTDYVDSSIGSVTFIDGNTGYYDITISSSVIQKWIDTPDQNYGIVLKPSSSYTVGEFAVLDSSEAGNVPELVVTSIPEPAASVLLIGVGGLALMPLLRRRR